MLFLIKDPVTVESALTREGKDREACAQLAVLGNDGQTRVWGSYRVLAFQTLDKCWVKVQLITIKEKKIFFSLEFQNF